MKLILLGDMAFFGKCSLGTNTCAKDYFADVAKRLEVADYVVGNLETPFSIRKKTYGAKSAYICSEVQNVKLLKQLNVKAVTLGNNHMFDYGKEGYVTTKRVLKDNGIEFFGSEGKGVYLDFDNNHLAFEGFCCYSSNPLQTVSYGEYGINEYNLSTVDKVLTKHDKENRLSILAVHAGLEHVNFPSLDHIKAARYLASKHKYIYYGHHPHVAQGIEMVDGSLIAYSLGNFCFDDVWSSASKDKPLVELTENNRSSFMLEITIDNNDVKGYEIIPIYIGKDKLYVGRGTTAEDLKRFTDFINSMQPQDYEKMRKEILTKRISERKAQRNFEWYLKRLRPRYVKIMLNARHNAKKYAICLTHNNS